MPSSFAKRSRSALANAALAAVALLVAFALGEAGARVFYHPENLGTIIRFDPYLGWSLKPRAVLHSVDSVRDLDYTIRVNSMGMREREFDTERDAHRGRILFCGDSFGFGVGVEAERRCSDFVGRALPNDEVLNASVCGWGTDQELIQFERLGQTLHPDVVVLTFCMSNDVLNNMLDHIYLGGTPKPRFILDDGELTLEKEKLEEPRVAARHQVRRWLRQSRLLLFAKRRIDAVRTENTEAAEVNEARAGGGVNEAAVSGEERRQYTGYGRTDKHVHSHWSVFEKEYDAETEAGWRVTEALLARFRDDCDRIGAELIVFAFPLEIEVDDEWRRLTVEHAGINPERLDVSKPFARLESICARLGVEYVHPVDEFRAAAERRRLYFERDVHPNDYGHAAAATALLQDLRDRHGRSYVIANQDLPFVDARAR